jgi:hypothetical protein
MINTLGAELRLVWLSAWIDGKDKNLVMMAREKN